MAADKLCKIDSLYLPLEDYMEEPSGIEDAPEIKGIHWKSKGGGVKGAKTLSCFPLSYQRLHLEKNSRQLAKR